MKVLLIQPPLLYYTRVVKLPNVGLATIAAVLEEAGINVIVIDANAETISLDQIIERIKKIKPDIVGSGGQTPVSHFSIEIFKRIKKEINDKILCIAGGPHFSFTDKTSLQQCPELDVVVRGEAEYTFLHLCKNLGNGKDFRKIKGITYRNADNKIIANPNQDPIKNLDDLPFPAWHLFPIEKYHDRGRKTLSITTARGCPYKCPHCITWKVHKGVRIKSPKRIVDEMIYLKENFGHDVFFFHDDQSFTQREQLEGFLDELEKRNDKLFWNYETREEVFYNYKDLWDRMKANGLFKVYFGIDTFSEKNRKLSNRSKCIKKQFIEMLDYLENKLDIIVYLYFTMGYPFENEENINRTIEDSKYFFPNLCSLVICSLLMPFPGTELYQEMKQKDLILTEDWRYYGSVTPVLKTSISTEKLHKLYYSFWKKNYSRPVVLSRQLKNLLSRNNFRRDIAKAFLYIPLEMMKLKRRMNFIK